MKYSALVVKSDGKVLFDCVIAGERRIELSVEPMTLAGLSNEQPANEDVRNAIQIVSNIITTESDSPALRDVRRLLTAALAKLER